MWSRSSALPRSGSGFFSSVLCTSGAPAAGAAAGALPPLPLPLPVPLAAASGAGAVAVAAEAAAAGTSAYVSRHSPSSAQLPSPFASILIFPSAITASMPPPICIRSALRRQG